MRQTIRVWSIQRTGCWERFQERGILYADGRRVCHHFRPAYRWLMSQMKERVAGCRGLWPVWFWYSPKPDLRHSAHLPRGERGVRLELELPLDRTLLLDFETWHAVLNRWHLSQSRRESEEWDRKTSQYSSRLPRRLQDELQATWRRVFDIELLRRAEIWGPIDTIQGVTEYIRLDEVRRVTPFVNR